MPSLTFKAVVFLLLFSYNLYGAAGDPQEKLPNLYPRVHQLLAILDLPADTVLRDLTSYQLEPAHYYNTYMYDLTLMGKTEIFEAELPGFLEMAAKVEDSLFQANVSATLGYYEYRLRRDYTAALGFFEGSLETLKAHEAEEELSDLYPHLIDCYLQVGDSDRVKLYLREYGDFLGSRFANETDPMLPAFKVPDQFIVANNLFSYKQKWALFFFFLAVLIFIRVYFWFNGRKGKAGIPAYGNLQSRDFPESGDAATDQLSGAEKADTRDRQFAELFDRILKLMETEEAFLDPGLKIDDLALALGTNKKYVSRAISLGADSGFNAFINTFRIRKACELLADLPPDTNGNLKDIALNSGFSNQSSFQRKFKQITGTTPYTYQRSVTGSHTDPE